ncbi:hypothetical protein [Pseudoteredinibacter isoporae]|uniref:Uncharacterized protein n=1 Tax=Pseudoteredinibacter isoporae TaxID=570281 RepID=A0A7X0JW00_9GAMM|nr:hypothetical protein [Pseudoteredinibacter isoporae]MBB6523284.1 hypothetical protein [Pseudoteredinibacter isoporae]NHO88798.1 hypothetical protein [Pseudoteredinibacter isoporae]NIB24494.1 hypothetical protein [Pseudoteredinibacter isoporae]
MGDLHIDDFYRDSARILLQLYRHFPRRELIYTEDIAGPDTPDDFGLPSDRHQACFATLLWLAENDYLSYGSTIAQEALDQAVLNQRGFNLLATLEDRNEFLPEAGLNEKDGEEALTRSQLLRHKIKYESSTRLNHYMRYLFTL